jgi:hypothetical protein
MNPLPEDEVRRIALTLGVNNRIKCKWAAADEPSREMTWHGSVAEVMADHIKVRWDEAPGDELFEIPYAGTDRIVYSHLGTDPGRTQRSWLAAAMVSRNFQLGSSRGARARGGIAWTMLTIWQVRLT